ncbi:lytic transglycosylase domain-containing protein [Photobacterium sp. GJ3]|uniref:lytic transglycosylase domain-containing protein n=1 Tax=Photobacterium sp. GJ3 TaxID=2829502 RepID=UPI002010F69F|nr:lytic transglycosylase domain-containing protein [Photobacterium sp. GJ3]
MKKRHGTRSRLMAVLCLTGLFLWIPGTASADPANPSFSLSAEALQAQVDRLLPHKKVIERHLLRNRETLLAIETSLRQKSLPLSLALLPMIESTFRVDAVSHANAAGLWQLIPATAKRFGLRVEQDHDERFDVARSTQAAVAYLSFLYQKFDQDLSLTLAAYNAGEGRVSRAMKRANSRQFSQLVLPRETRDYVHKFHALLSVVDLKALTQPPALSPDARWLALPKAPTDLESRILMDLFAKRNVINMAPVQPLIAL